MRVLHFAAKYHPVPGGATRRVENMLASPENRHVLVVPRPQPGQYPEVPGGVPDREVRGHVEIRRVEMPPAPSSPSLSLLFSGARRARLFEAQAGDESFDLVHSHNPPSCALAALRYRRRHELPLVHEVHGIMQDAHDFHQLGAQTGWIARGEQRVLRHLAAAVEQRVLSRAGHVIVQTELVKRRVLKLYRLDAQRVTVIRNGVNPDEFDPDVWQARRVELRRQRGWNRRTVCLYAGYLDRVNGIDFLLRVLPQLRGPARHQLRMVLAGPGPLESSVRRATDEHPDLLEYVGVLPPTEMAAYYAASDVFVIPRPESHYGEHLLPIKLLEAMAMQKLLLVSDVAAMTEIITDGENGLVFKKGSTADFMHKLETIAAPGARFEELGRRARQDVLHQYTWEASRQQLQSIYRRLLQN